MNVRVRFAPSPTGLQHIGGLRTSLYNYLVAKKHGGAFILRIEDTDQKRFVEGALENTIAFLNEFGLRYDEGPFMEQKVPQTEILRKSENYPGIVEVGEAGPYIQSERLDIYRQYADELIANGRAYHCFCSAERLEAVRAEQTKNKQAPKYDKHCLSLPADEVKHKLESGESHVIRLNVLAERGDISFDDLVRGEVKINVRDIDDQVLMKSDGFPTYHLASIIDDHLMRITHVIRGEEWLPSAPKHILLYEAFGWKTPEFAHLPNILGTDGRKKLSKRDGDVSVESFVARGYLREALINFVALLGWNPGQGSTQELFSLQELEQVFDLGNVHKAGAVFDMKKLDWMNGEYIKKLSIDELYERVLPFIVNHESLPDRQAGRIMNQESEGEFWKKVLTIEKDRLTKLADAGVQNPFFFAEQEYDVALLNWKENTVEMTKESLIKAEEILSGLNDTEWSRRDILEKILLEAAGDHAQNLGGIEAGKGKGDFLWPLRVALTGADRSPSPFDVAWVLGREESLKRLRSSIQRLS